MTHIPGSDNQVADALSRLNVISMPVVMSTTELAEEQSKDPELTQVLQRLPTVDNYKYCLTIIDRWPEAVPLKEISADTIATGIYANWIARFGAPATITTDRGAQFESQIFNSLAKLIGCRHIRTTVYHSPSNGMIERWHRSSYKHDIQATAAEMIYGTRLRMPGEFFVDTETHTDFTVDKFRRHMQENRPRPTRHHSKRSYFIFDNLFKTTHVFIKVDHVRHPLEQPYSIA
ncbi:uncharacterized protein LOC122535515 [Frieseomelitta varia]|uniref:uncharacterized protein LOC122535515 n=1 Tax=Frieseomelitta varia TaxID=561572 RepID=UPI001CB6AD1D|nr:uncharacterized protein LOC122535515 [Frieseomelitta varia]